MTRSEREQLIERYLSGQMSGGQEENFFIEVAANRELRQELKAYRVVEQAMAEEGAAIAHTYTSLRTHLQGMLVATGAGATAGRGESVSASGSGAGTTAGMGTGGGSLLGGLTLSAKLIVGSIAVVAITVGTILLDPFGSSDPTQVAPSQSIEGVQPVEQYQSIEAGKDLEKEINKTESAVGEIEPAGTNREVGEYSVNGQSPMATSQAKIVEREGSDSSASVDNRNGSLKSTTTSSGDSANSPPQFRYKIGQPQPKE